MWVKKFNAGTTLLVVDSNILYTKNELEIINHDFATDLSECQRYERQQLLIPKVVISKLVFQKVMYAAALIADAAKALKTLSRLTESETVAVEDHKLARRKIERRIVSAFLVRAKRAKLNRLATAQ